MVPKVTTPLTKFVRTTEFWLVLAANIALVVVPIVTSAVKPGTSLLLGTILNSVAVASRTILKTVAVTQGDTGITYANLGATVPVDTPPAISVTDFNPDVSDAQEMASPPPESVAPSVQPESAITPDNPDAPPVA